MKEQLYTIPLMDAYRADDECPFCFIERKLQEHAIEFTIGPESSYMEDDVRFQTDKAGFCRDHYRQMFAYGNRLGSAMILETHLKAVRKELKGQMEHYSAGQGRGVRILPFRKAAKGKWPEGAEASNSVSAWIRTQTGSCFICEQIQSNYQRYLATFIELYKRADPAFEELLKNAKGYCLPHFGDLLDAAQSALGREEMEKLKAVLFPQMEQSLDRIVEDLDWFQKKFDYRYKDAEWKNAKDAVQRGMQKAGGGYPALKPLEAQS